MMKPLYIGSFASVTVPLRTALIAAALIALPFFAGGCFHESYTNYTGNPVGIKEVSAIKVGTTEDDVIKQFGPPTSRAHVDHEDIWTYQFSIQSESTDWLLIVLKNTEDTTGSRIVQLHFDARKVPGTFTCAIQPPKAGTMPVASGGAGEVIPFVETLTSMTNAMDNLLKSIHPTPAPATLPATESAVPSISPPPAAQPATSASH